MSSQAWIVKSHVVPASHISGYSRGVQDECSEIPLRLEVKQYTPRSNTSPQLLSLSLASQQVKRPSNRFYEDLLLPQMNSFASVLFGRPIPRSLLRMFLMRISLEKTQIGLAMHTI